jgi:transcriptional regulator with XRE-family HTH domain
MRYENNLKALQAARGLTIDQAAKAMGMSRGGYLKIQRGENRLTSTTIARAAQAFGVRESEVVSGVKAASVESSAVIGHNAVVAENGMVKLPDEICEMWGLRPGDEIEFFRDHAGRWQFRPRNAGPLDFLKHLPPRPKRADASTDHDALTLAMAERNSSPSAKART